MAEDTTVQTSSKLEQLAQMLELEYCDTLRDVEPPKELIHGEFSRLLGSWGKQFKIIPVA